MGKKIFGNVKVLERYLQNSKEIKEWAMKQLNIEKQLEEAAELLKQILQEEIQDYYDHYDPIEYIRTYEFLNSIKLTQVHRKNNTLYITVYFDPVKATHPSIFGGEPGFVPILLNEGWEWKNNIGIYRLSYYDGYRFVESAIERFNKKNKWGFQIVKDAKYRGRSI